MTKEEALQQIEVNESEISSHLLKMIEHKDKAKELKSKNRSLLAYIKNVKIVEEYNMMYALNKDHFKTQRTLAYKHKRTPKTIARMYYIIKKTLNG
jgi:hypothetical protein